ncbi:MAG: SurA N-terminal domain-containing protein [Deltaproteobacteria bacterium]|nr:SurA N-terminal domain-containing protein [Deltaproteobacteria bacterium]
MLDVLRKRKRSWLVLLLLGVGVLAFVMVGVGPQGGQQQVVTIAQVNGDEITYTELEIHYYRMLQTYRQLAGGRLSPADIEALNLRGQLLEELIQQRLLLQAADDLGLKVTDGELADGIARHPAFQAGGRFDRNAYRLALRGQGMTPAEFEAQQREALAIQKLRSLIADSIPVTAVEVEDRYRVENEEIALDFVRFDTDDFAEGVAVADEDIQAYYDGNGSLLREPLKVGTRYLEYRVDRFAEDIEVSDGDVQAYYDVYRERRFRQPEAVKFSQIFVPIAEGASPEDKAAAREQLGGILKRAREGADFAELAKQHSQDDSAADGGDMGFVVRGQLVAPLDAALFALEQGAISDVVESAIGLHLLKAVERREDKIRELEEVRDEIVAALKRERGGARAARAVEEDRERALDGVPLAQVARERGIEPDETPLFSAGETLDAIGDVEEFYHAALSLRPDQTGPIVASPDALYLLQGARRVEPAVPPLDDVKERIQETLTRRKAREQAQKKAEAFLAEVKGGADLREAAAAGGLAVEDTGLFPRKQANIPEVGILPLPLGRLTASKANPVVDTAYAQGDSFYVMVLRTTVEADLADLGKEKEELTRQIREEKGQRAFSRLIENLKANARIEIHPEFI